MWPGLRTSSSTTRSARPRRTTLATTARAAWRQRARTRMNTYEPEWNYGPAFFDARHNFVFSANYELPFGKGRRWGGNSSTLVDALIGGWRLGGNFQARIGLPDHGDRRREPVRCRVSAATSVRTASAIRGPSNQNIENWLDIKAFQRVRRSARGAIVASVSSARQSSGTSTRSSRSDSTPAASATSICVSRRST